MLYEDDLAARAVRVGAILYSADFSDESQHMQGTQQASSARIAKNPSLDRLRRLS
jgi:hypothetical protein